MRVMELAECLNLSPFWIAKERMTQRSQKPKSQWDSLLAEAKMETNMKQKTFDADLWIVVKPAADVPGVWVSHCLTLDLISQGDSAAHALQSVNEAIQVVVVDDLLAGRDPAARGAKTPAEGWAEQSRIVQHGSRFELNELAAKSTAGKVRWAVNMKFRVEVQEFAAKKVAAKRKTPAVQQQVLKIEQMPPAWKIASSSPHASHA